MRGLQKCALFFYVYFFGTKAYFLHHIIMILIHKGQSNKIVVTLSEKVTLSPVYYLFRFVNDVDRSEVSCVLEDTSLFIDRYNEFEFIEGTTETLTNKGFYHYYIYEQNNNTNLDYKNSGALLECGKLKVVGESENATTEFTANEIYKSFDNE